MTHDLVATFTNSLGSEHDWTYKDVDNSLPAQTIKEACELLTTLDIFEQNGVKLFDSVVTAKIVTTTETIILIKRTNCPQKNAHRHPQLRMKKLAFPQLILLKVWIMWINLRKTIHRRLFLWINQLFN